MRILTFMDYYLPGFKAGGPIRTVSAMVSRLPPQFQFMIVTRDRDHTENSRYPGIDCDVWKNVERARVLYLRSTDITLARLTELVRTTSPDVLYANSLFSRITMRVLVGRRLGSWRSLPMVLAPRGELSPGALKIRGGRKAAFLNFAAHVGLFKNLIWQASSESERSDISHALRSTPSIRVSRNIAIAPDIFEHRTYVALRPWASKRSGSARFVFLSRVSPMKNLRLAIELIGFLPGEVSLDIFGPVDDQEYLQVCKTAAAAAPPRVAINWNGSISPRDVLTVIEQFDFFILPTLGENFGHVILEALISGCPVLISNRTQWTNIETDGAGWTIPLEQRSRWMEALRTCVDMDGSSHQRMRERAQAAGREYSDSSGAIRQNVALFEEALSNASI